MHPNLPPAPLLTLEILRFKVPSTQGLVSECFGFLPWVAVEFHLNPTILFTAEMEPEVTSRQPLLPSLWRHPPHIVHDYF